MDKKKLTFEDILRDDPLGLIGDVKPAASPTRTEDERLITSFQEINDFYKKHKREPGEGSIQEFSLYARLKGMRANPEKIKVLKKYDEFNLLPEIASETDYSTIILPKASIAAEPPPEQIIEKKEPPIEVNSINDILKNDILGLLDGGNEADIFNFKHVKRPEERAQIDFVARRKPCKDFDKYEPLFQQVQADLKSGKRKLIKFREGQIEEGNFFVAKGVLCYVAKLYSIKRGDHSKMDGRTLTIFENGTESNLKFRSLGKAIFEDGWAVSFPDEDNDDRLQESANAITKEDQARGFIYVLRSKSQKPQIAGINDLYKIGYSSTPVEDRIKNAEKEPTYLMAPVHLVTTYKVFNVEPQKFESLLHRFFGSACLDINLYDANGQMYRPREWFVAPIGIIEEVIALILSGEIVKYRYDVGKKVIVGK